MIRNIEHSRRSIGVNFRGDGTAEILVWAPNVKKVCLRLLDNNKLLRLQEQEYGYWLCTTNLLRPGDLYSFVLDDQKEFPDPASLSQPEGVHGPSQAVDLNHFQWNDQLWKNIPIDEYIFYELHVGTFTDKGTFRAIEKKIPYLLSLGITAIEIMPVAQFPGSRNWGYDGVFPFAVQQSYGGAQGLQYLVDICHTHGLAVVLDVVYNHLGPEGNYIQEYAPYFTDKYKTPWGNAVNFDDAGSDGVRHYFIENALMWFRDFHIDALRIDAAHAIKDFSPTHILREMRQHVDQYIHESRSIHHLITEVDLNDNRFISPYEQGGYGMDAQWCDEFHHALRVTTGHERTGYYADYDGVRHLAKAYRDAYVYDGIYSPHRQKTFGTKTDEHPGHQFVVFSQNHDQVGNRMLGERTSQLVNFELAKLMAGATLVSPYLPLLFMGEEYGETHPFLYFVSHSDEELVQSIRQGRKKEFASFHIAGEAPDPQSEETFQQSKLQWELIDKDQHAVLLSYYKKLIALRKENPALRHLDRKQLEVQCNEENKTLQLHRWHREQHVRCLMNFSDTLQPFTVAWPHRWQKILDSADPEFLGPSASSETLWESQVITLPPHAIVLYAATYG
ncbi:malto-oligosyltrehalose trehalohydrolase [Ohtaekwangia sp.]|uniref:malto-oligosyltrehalose trehalohydrolase n=1 Tax=Ohtaekwangia sp. TaxID=2066019 RepID=UPI002FDE16DD